MLACVQQVKGGEVCHFQTKFYVRNIEYIRIVAFGLAEVDSGETVHQDNVPQEKCILELSSGWIQ